MSIRLGVKGRKGGEGGDVGIELGGRWTGGPNNSLMYIATAFMMQVLAVVNAQ